MNTKDNLLDSIASPADLRAIPEDRLGDLAEQMRARITDLVSEKGGHLASNLGVVELTIALHRIFDFSKDRLFMDVGHQCYPHKMLTGRNECLDTLRSCGGVSGFPSPAESEYDACVAGHASTAISSALGYARAVGRGGPRSIAMVGDGAIGGGLAFEGMNSAGHMDADLLVILNDNAMSINETVGGLSKYLGRLRVDPLYNDLRKEAGALVERMPILGAVGRKVVDGIRHAVSSGGVFEALGFRYFGPVDGHNISELETMLRSARDLTGPVLLHVLTNKGEGHASAVEDPASYHAPSSAKLAADAGREVPPKSGSTYSDVASDTIVEVGKKDKRIVAITAAMAAGTGLAKCRDAWPSRFYDVGICEAHAVTFAGGLAHGGKIPVVSLYSTFLQRAIDSVFHDICLQETLPIVLCVDRAGVVGPDGPTHHGLFDIPMLRAIPNLIVAAPGDGDEVAALLRWAIGSGKPVAIRYPRDKVPAPLEANPPIELGKGVVLSRGERVAIVGYGASVAEALQARQELEAEGTSVTVANGRFAKPVDSEMLKELASTHDHIVTVEEGSLIGGFGSAVMEDASISGWDAGKVQRLGVGDSFVAGASRGEQLETLGIDAKSIAAKVRSILGQ